MGTAEGTGGAAQAAEQAATEAAERPDQAARDAKVDGDGPPKEVQRQQPDSPPVHAKLQPLMDRASQEMGGDKFPFGGVPENGTSFVKGDGPSREGGDMRVSYWGVWDPKTPARAELTLEAPRGSAPPKEPKLNVDISTPAWTIREETPKGPAPPVGW